MSRSPCVPACQACGRDLLPDDQAAAYQDRGQSFWRRSCECVVEHAPEPDYGFSNVEVATFKSLLIERGCDDGVADVLAQELLNSLADRGTKVVLGLPENDLVVTAEEARELLGRDLREDARGRGAG